MSALFSYITSFDLKLEKMILHWRTNSLDHLFFIITYLGYWLTVVIIFFILSFLFKKYGKSYLVTPLLLSLLGSGVTVLILKFLTGRNRPPGDIPLYVEKLSSFPSAHAALIFTLCAFLIYTVSQSNYSLSVKTISILSLILIIGLVGFSRLYLGVHFFSDVLAGYLVGLLWTSIAVYLTHRQTVN